MSDHLTRWIPLDPSFVPDEASAARAVEWLRARAPAAEHVTANSSSTIRFVDCGANLEAIHCRRCGAQLSLTWWDEAMETAAATDFEDRAVRLPCCGEPDTLEMLRYDEPAGFARFVLEARNADIGAPTAEDDERVGALLGTPVRHVLAHY
jgi:hypothetical protein